MTDQQQVAEITDRPAVEPPPASGAVPAASKGKTPRLPSAPAGEEIPERPRFFKVYQLTDKAQRFIRDRLEHFQSVPQIRRELQQKFSESITHGSLARYATYYRRDMSGRKQIRNNVLATIEALREKGHELSLQVQAQLLEVVMQAAKENKLAELGPYAISKLALAFADSERKERKLALSEEMDRRKAEVQEGELQLARQEAQQAVPAEADKKTDPEVSPADAIRELFGLPDENEEHHSGAGIPACDTSSGGAGIPACDNSAGANACNTSGEVPKDDKGPDDKENE